MDDAVNDVALVASNVSDAAYVSRFEAKWGCSAATSVPGRAFRPADRSASTFD